MPIGLPYLGTVLSDISARALELLEQQGGVADLTALNVQLRKEGEGLSDITWVLQQLELRAKAKSKLGERASHLLFTRNGLEQATRWPVARYHAQRLARLGSVTDLGCGLGIDSLAFCETGLQVVAIEQDAETAQLAAWNLKTQNAEVQTAAAQESEIRTTGVWLDPARRNLAGRFDARRMVGPEDFSPSLDFAFSLLTEFPGGVKLAPGLPHELIPKGLEATWVSHNRELVELSLWNLDPARAGKRFAVMVSDSQIEEFSGEVFPAQLAELGKFICEPEPALIRSGLIGAFAQEESLTAIAKDIAYLSSNQLPSSPWLRSFEVLENLPIDKKLLRKRLGAMGVGRLEIKKRGVDIDPAQLRKEMKLKGEGAATLILTRVGDARRALVCNEC